MAEQNFHHAKQAAVEELRRLHQEKRSEGEQEATEEEIPRRGEIGRRLLI